MKRWKLPVQDQKPSTPKYPTADFAHDMASAVAEAKKRKKKGRGKKLNGVDLEV